MSRVEIEAHVISAVLTESGEQYRSSGSSTNDSATIQQSSLNALCDFYNVATSSAPQDWEESPAKRRRTDDGAVKILNDETSSLPDNSITLASVTISLECPETSKYFQEENISTLSAPVHLDGLEGNVQSTCLALLPEHDSRRSLTLKIAGKDSGKAYPHLEWAIRLQSSQSPVGRTGRSAPPRRAAGRAFDIASVECQLHPPRDGLRGFQLSVKIRWRLGKSPLDAKKSVASNLEMEVFRHYLRDQDPDADTPWSLQDFYENVYVPPSTLDVSSLVDSHLLESRLYPFQARTVSWLLEREGVRLRKGTLVCEPISSTSLQAPAGFCRVVDAEGRSCYISQAVGLALMETSPELPTYTSLRGGILAEEMGLGKTVELIALIRLHARVPASEILFDPYLGWNLRTSGATLIITPPSILQQWQSEIASHAPNLTVYHYTGIGGSSKGGISASELARFDVVLTTYSVLSREIHHAIPPPERSFRRSKVHEARRSPLVEISWWRVCLDEAQMVESGVSKAATVARLIPRCNAWAISGTPLRKDVQDLLGLLIFLCFEPFSSSKRMWENVDKSTFKAIFNSIALRHTKSRIRQELRLPPQKRVVMTVPFTPVEEQNYTHLIQQMCEDCGVDTDGAPLHGEWDPSDPKVVESMRMWLVRLRQTCLHPQVGKRNRRALGRSNAPLRTVAEVLDVMIEQNETSLRADERESILLDLLHGHIVANAKQNPYRSQDALNCYMGAVQRAEKYAQECKEYVNLEQTRLSQAEGIVGDVMKKESEGEVTDVEEIDSEHRVRLTKAKQALRSSLEVQHACLFFVGTACYQIKSNEELTQPDSENFRMLEAQETEYYDMAKAVRRTMLHDSHLKAHRSMKMIKEETAKDSLPVVQLPQSFWDGRGIENRKFVEAMDRIETVMNRQLAQLKEWREKVVKILLMPLVDEEEHGKETTGDEYEDSTKAQDELYAYFDALRAIVADFNYALTGQADLLIDNEMKTAVKFAKEGEGHAPELMLKVLELRLKLRPGRDDMSLRGIIAGLRSLASTLEWRSDGKDRAGAELQIVQRQLEQAHVLSSTLSKAFTKLEKQLDTIRTTMNTRLEYYRQMQQISDTVAPWREELDETLDTAAMEAQGKKATKVGARLATLKTKQRFLTHLKDETGNEEGKKLCVICQSTFQVGVLTVCGHIYCTECIKHWWSAHRTCPICKRHLHSADFHDITYKEREVRAEEEDNDAEAGPPQFSNTTASPSRAGRASALYAHASTSLISSINRIDLNGSYGTKIDTIARHLLWIREHDPGSKTVIFSQFTEFLSVLKDALQHFKIGVTSIQDKKMGIEAFKRDPSAECFLLDANTDASGLTLVNATYVFLCEPLINAALELQAIARVHRIGQQRPTTVFMYLISDTVEEAIYEISVARRLAHLGRDGRGGSNSSTSRNSRTSTPTPQEIHENVIDAANTQEMQKAPVSRLLLKGKGGGEVVAKDDLWDCLFKRSRRHQQNASQALEMEVNRHLRAEAATERADA